MQEQNMNCPYCGESIPNNSKKCPACNESLEDYYILCPACAESIPKDSKKCPVCGEYLEDLSMNINAPIPSSNINIIKVLIIIFSVVAILIVLGLGSWFAYKWYNDPVRKADRMAKSYLTLAKKQEKEGNNKEAISNYIKALDEKFELDEAKVPLVKLCIKEKDMACVKKYIDVAYELSSNDTQLKFYYATSIINEHDKSIPLLKSVVEKEPNNYLANKYLGAYYCDKEELKTALPYLKKSFELKDSFKNDTGVEEIYSDVEDEGILLASVYIINEEYTNAINVLDKIINKTGSYSAKELKEEAIQRRNYYNYIKEREKAEAAARKEEEAYNRSREEYYRNLRNGYDY